jgi:hypothetical protein
LKSRLRATDHRRVKPIAINTDKLYDTDLTDAAWALNQARVARNIAVIYRCRFLFRG